MAVKTSSPYDDIMGSYDGANKTDFSWAFGIGYQSPSNVGIDLRYNLGLTALLGKNDFNSNVHRGVFQLGMFYVLRSK